MSAEEALNACLDQEEEDLDPSVEVAADAPMKVVSTNMWAGGPVTMGKSLVMVREQAARQAATANDKKRKAELRTSEEDGKRMRLFVEGTKVLAQLDENKKQVDKLTVKELDALLAISNKTCKGIRAEKLVMVNTWRQEYIQERALLGK